jgi:tripartite-type tricarboxylate transporter receptor subunit TctC
MNLGQYTLALLSLAACGNSAVQAQDAWPSKPVRVVVGLAPGGATDVQARLYSLKLSEQFGQSFVVENRAGAGGMVGITNVISAAPDGYTTLAVTPGYTISPAFHEKPPYDIKALAPVSLLTKATYFFVVSASSSFKSMKDFIAHAKAKPGEMNFGTGGPGTSIHLGGAWIGNATGTAGKPGIQVVHYKGTNPALMAVIANQLHATFASPISVLPQVKAGKLRALAVTSAERSKVFTDYATISESGVPGLDITTWHGWLVPRGTPQAVVTRLNGGLVKAVTSNDVAGKLAADGIEAVGSTPEAFGKFIDDEVGRWRKLVRETGIKVDAM